jgi:hypothetical protein
VDLEPEPAEAEGATAGASEAASSTAAADPAAGLRRPAVEVLGVGRVRVRQVDVVEVVGVRGRAPEGERDLLAVLGRRSRAACG